MKKLIIIILIIAAIAAGAFAWVNRDDSDGDTSSDQSSQTTEETSATDEQAAEEPATDADVAATITYTESGFSIDTETVASGATIEIINDSDETLDFASNEHPVHTDNSEFNVGLIEPGEGATFVVTDTGTWGFHNHVSPTLEGEITVE